MSTILSLLSAAFFSSGIGHTDALPAKQGNKIASQVSHLSQKAPQLNKRVLKMALTAYQKASAKGAVKKSVLTVIDYSLPSNKQRMWIFDVNKERLLYNTYVAHGQNSGSVTPNHFSNTPSSKATSLGTFVTRDTYIGSKGYSLNLQGLERGFNDNAYNRRVVIHGAWYVEPDFIRKAGRAGRSWGCPSIAQTMAKPVINTIKGGSVVFAYYPDKKYLRNSDYATA
ncbi:MAG: murein L,D-transpeptidase catalytic domain family protein [Proteobacteria bacterium]|nr:murein L,D-transpeptidase catalytic domain family protein [Pseudomonadota bacterium]